MYVRRQKLARILTRLTDIFYDPLLGAYRGAVLEDMLREVDPGDGWRILNLLDCLGDLVWGINAHGGVVRTSLHMALIITTASYRLLASL